MSNLVGLPRMISQKEIDELMSWHDDLTIAQLQDIRANYTKLNAVKDAATKFIELNDIDNTFPGYIEAWQDRLNKLRTAVVEALS